MTQENDQKNSEDKENNNNSAENKESTENKEKEISVEEKLVEAEDKLLRALAETENQRRRFEKEIKEAFNFGGFNFAKENLAILDNLQRAKSSIKDDETLKNSKDFEKFFKNIEIIETDLISIFEKNKITKINTSQQKFDPNLHQAMLEIEDEKLEPGTIVQEIQAGYMYDERLLRPSFVGVAKKKIPKNEEKDVKKDDL